MYVKEDDKVLNASLEVLIAEFRETNFTARCEELQKKIFAKLYLRFDLWIKGVLRRHNVPYNAGDKFFNVLFFDIYKDIFYMESLKKIAVKYDFSKNNFEKYLYSIVKNSVIDWLRSKRPNEKNSCDNNALTYDDEIKIRHLNSYDRSQDIDTYERLNGVPIQYRIVMILKHLIVLDLIEEEFEYISDETGRTIGKIKSDVASFREDLMKSEKHIELMKASGFMHGLEYRLRSLEGQLNFLKETLYCLGVTDSVIKVLEIDGSRRTLSEISTSINAVREEGIVDMAKGCELAKMQYMLKYRQFINTNKKFIKNRELSTKSVTMPSRKIAEILNISVNLVDKRYFDGKKFLLNHKMIGRNQENFSN